MCLPFLAHTQKRQLIVQSPSQLQASHPASCQPSHPASCQPSHPVSSQPSHPVSCQPSHPACCQSSHPACCQPSHQASCQPVTQLAASPVTQLNQLWGPFSERMYLPTQFVWHAHRASSVTSAMVYMYTIMQVLKITDLDIPSFSASGSQLAHLGLKSSALEAETETEELINPFPIYQGNFVTANQALHRDIQHTFKTGNRPSNNNKNNILQRKKTIKIK